MKSSAMNIAAMSDRLFNALPGMLILYDRDGNILDVRNPDAELMVLSDENNAVGRPVGELADLLRERLAEVFDTRRTSQFLYAHKRADGQERIYDVFLARVDKKCLLAGIRAVPETSLARIESQHLYEFFAEVLDNVAIPVSVKSVDTGRYVFWSKKAELFGRTAGEIIGGTEQLFMPAAQARAVQEIGRRLAEGREKRYQGIERYTTRDGREHTFVIARTLFVFGGERLILSSALDISELTETKVSLMNTKNELADRNMILTSVLNLADIVPWGCDLGAQVFYCDYDAYHPEHAPGPDRQGRYVIPMNRYFDSIHPDHRSDAVRMICELVKGERKEVRDTYLVHWFNDREWEWVQIQSSVSRCAPDGRPMQLIGSAQCVTERKRNELALCRAKEELDIRNAMLSSVLGIAQIMPWVGDLKTGIFYCDYNVHHREDSQLPEPDGRYATPLKTHFDRIHPDYRAHAYDKYVDLLEGRTTEFHEIYPIRWKNEREYEWLEMQGSVYRRGEGGEPLELIGSARVVTAQRRMEDSLRAAKEQAERSNMFKSAFLANMSHEIRTPLNAIVGFSELLAQTDDPAEKQEYVGIIQNSNALLLQLIADILDLSKIEAGTLEFSFADHDLSSILAELEQTARMKLDNPSVEVACTDSPTGCRIYTDRGRLMQVLNNFITNAAKFTRKGHIHFGCKKQVDGRWYFYVEDTGCGIAADVVGSVFDRFVKLNMEAKGTGLGLAISKSIIERLHGEIGVFSAEGQGSTFWFVLPAEIVTAGSFARAADATPSGNACGESGSATILVAEDDPANYKLFEAMLKKHYTVLHAWNGCEAVNMYRERRPDMILMDIKMPEMDGYQATEAIRKISPDVPIVAVTAFAYPDDMRKILSNGFNGCLPKPVSADKLKEKIAELCCHKTGGC